MRYITRNFNFDSDERKEPEMQIGLPTDVKHMKGFESLSGSNPSSPINIRESKQNLAVEAIFEESKRGHRKSLNQGSRDQPDLPKSTRHNSSKDKASESDSPRKQKSRNSRRHHLKDSDSTRLSRDGSMGTIDSPSNDLPDVPKKSRRKKSKDPNSTHRSSRSRGRGSGSGSGSSFASCTSDLESSVKSTCSNKEGRECNEVC
ncbi:hypothetical protein Leryth_003385 [Lithospermum erythrorhizon]|nr:hypothetical protein Leryth_003385 [Lithospermum erythrorhizon]